MQMSRAAKVVLGVLTALPVVYVLLFVALIIRLIVLRASDPHADAMPVPMSGLMPVHLGMMFLVIGLEAFYLLYVFKSDRIPPDQRTRWAVALLVVNIAAMPLFFGFHVWPERGGRRT